MSGAFIERRLGEAGFIYVNRTRMGFSPKSAINHTDAAPGEPIVLWRAARWPEPTTFEVAQCIAALDKAYPNRVIELG